MTETTAPRYYVAPVRTVKYVGEPLAAVVQVVDGGTGNGVRTRQLAAGDAEGIAAAIAELEVIAAGFNADPRYLRRPSA